MRLSNSESLSKSFNSYNRRYRSGGNNRIIAKPSLAKIATMSFLFLEIFSPVTLVDGFINQHMPSSNLRFPNEKSQSHISKWHIMKPYLNPRQDKENKISSVSSSIPTSLIAREDTWGNIAALTAISSFSQSVGPKTRIGRLLGPPVTAMAIAFLFGSIQILPSGGSPAAKLIQSMSLNLATPLLLFSADLKEAKETCGPLLKAFLYASMGTLLACTLAMLTPPLGSMIHAISNSMNGNDGIKIAAALMAKNIGGGLNYIAVCQTLQASPNAIAAGLCVDNVYALLYFPVTSALAKGRPDVSVISSSSSMEKSEQRGTGGFRKNNITVEDLSTALALATLSTWIGEIIGGPFSASLPCSTIFTILLTTILPRFPKKSKESKNNNLLSIPDSMTLQNLRPAGEVLGTSLLYLFFATAGAPGLAIAKSVRASFLPLSIFLLCLYSGHGAFLLLVRYLHRRILSGSNTKECLAYDEEDGAVAPQRLLVASSAAIGGPATAAALAQANGWHSLVGPSLLVGNLGYAIATFLGIAFYGVFKQ